MIDWMSSPVIVVDPATSLAEAQRLMEHHRIRRLPVVQDGILVGIITWSNIKAAQPPDSVVLSTHAWRTQLERLLVGAYMTHHPETIAPHASVAEAAHKLMYYKIGGLPVLEHGKVVGIITESDLLELLIVDETRPIELR